MLVIHKFDSAKRVAMNFHELVPTRMLLQHELLKSRVIKLLDSHFFSLIGLIAQKTESECFIEVADFIIFSIHIFNWCSVKSAQELDSCNRTLPRFWASKFLAKDRIIQGAQVSDLREFTKLIKRLPVVDQIIFN